MREKEMVQIVEYIDTVLSNVSNASLIASIKEEIHNWTSNFPLYAGKF